ncbi:MAG: 6-phosphofructokinase [Oscillospiraceae bacterium]|nr:6-phosphofructokinase [Oscillospiraceae bacterium]
MENVKRVGVLTSGGDAPGMNAAVRAVVRQSIGSGIQVVAIYEGFKGLLEKNVKEFKMRDVSNIINTGGTILYSARCDYFRTPEGVAEGYKCARELELDAIIGIGGDGTLRGLHDLSQHGLAVVGIPGTIDNDMTATEYTIGYDTAMNTAVDMVDRLRDTCESHFRCNVVEVMGRRAGYIALHVGLATGAAQIVTNEVNFDEEWMFSEIIRGKENKKRHYIIMVAEGVEGYSEGIVQKIQERTGIETRLTRLGHVVRGGSPTLRDRVVASRMGIEAVDLLSRGEENKLMVKKGLDLSSVDIDYALTLDRMYKGSLTEGDHGRFSREQIVKMRQTCEKKREKFAALYRQTLDISQ